MPLKAPSDTLDTRIMYRKHKVSYGLATTTSLFCDRIDSANERVTFRGNAEMILNKIDERNLIHCRYLNLNNSRVKLLRTTYLCDLRALLIWQTDISKVDTAPLIRLVYLDASSTKLTLLKTRSLGDLKFMDVNCVSISATNVGDLKQL